MRTSTRLAGIAIAASFWAANAAAQLPTAVAERLEQIVVPEDAEEFFGSYRMQVSSVVAKPDGSKRKTTEIEVIVDRPSDGGETRHLLSFTENGVDTAAEHRAEIEDAVADTKSGDDGDGELGLPVGEHAADFRFSAPRALDGHLEVDFEPRPAIDDDDAVRGTIAWDEMTQEPLWIELEPVDPPSPLKELHVRMETAPIAGQLVVTRMTTSGRVAMLLMKRRFTSDVRFVDVSPIAEAAAD